MLGENKHKTNEVNLASQAGTYSKTAWSAAWVQDRPLEGQFFEVLPAVWHIWESNFGF